MSTSGVSNPTFSTISAAQSQAIASRAPSKSLKGSQKQTVEVWAYSDEIKYNCSRGPFENPTICFVNQWFIKSRKLILDFHSAPRNEHHQFTVISKADEPRENYCGYPHKIRVPIEHIDALIQLASREAAAHSEYEASHKTLISETQKIFHEYSQKTRGSSRL